MRQSVRTFFVVPLCVLLSVAAADNPAPQSARPAAGATAAKAGGPQPPLDRAGAAWVRATLRRMTLAEKVGQVFFLRTDGRFLNQRSRAFLKLRERIEKLHLGGIVVYAGTPHDTAAFLNAAQRRAKVPLLVGGDLERGAAMRIAMASALPDNMAIAATGDPANAAFAGEVTAREARALGIHWTYSPVADVNNNPDNPIINIRSYGEDPEQVARMVAAYIQSAEAHGVLTSAKHFPGHGDTATDSHIALGVVGGDRARLERMELVPFRAAIEAGVSSIMTAHLSVPAFEPDSRLPATLSRAILTDLLRQQMGFDGLIVTDALDMGGITRYYWPGEAAVRAFEAGADVLLLPPNPETAYRALLAAVRSGRIPVQRLNDSVERILRAKARVELHRRRYVDLPKISENIANPEFQARIDSIASRSITLVRDEARHAPLPLMGRKKVAAIVMAADPGPAGAVFSEELRRRVEDAVVLRVDPSLTEEQAREVLKRAGEADVVVAALFVRVVDSKGTVGLPERHVALLRQAAALGKPLVALSFGNPYLIRAFPEIGTYLCAFSVTDVSQRAAVRAIFGETPITGRLPVSIPGVAPLGTGIERAALDMKLQRATAGQEQRFARAFEAMEAALAGRAFPGGVVAVGHRGRLVALKTFGRFDYSEQAPPVAADTIWDLASVSKVVGATTATAMLVERGDLLLDVPVVRYLPEFAGTPGHDDITVRQLLTHSSGLPSYEKLFLEEKDKQGILNRIYKMPMAAKPGEKVAYSDFGLILLGETLERVSGQPLDIFLKENLFVPLGMKETTYRPPAELRERIPPTEDDPFRKRVVRGEVHDENTWVMGGVAGHAGLFSTAGDLALFCQMMLNGGTYDGVQLLKRGTVDMFTARQPGPPGSTRALGWDTPSEPESRVAGRFFSPRSFGHTGFTGTSIYLDPEKQLFVILLTNRVHPTRERNQMDKVRPAVHDAVVEALR